PDAHVRRCGGRQALAHSRESARARENHRLRLRDRARVAASRHSRATADRSLGPRVAHRFRGAFVVEDSIPAGCDPRPDQYRAERHVQGPDDRIRRRNSADPHCEHVRHEFPRHARARLALGLRIRPRRHRAQHAGADRMVQMARMVVRIAPRLIELLSPRRRNQRVLRARWGQPGTNDGWLASRYFELTRLEDGARQVDDRAWNDLELARIFARLDSATTRVGSQSLYRRLRTYRDDEASARAEYAALQRLRRDRRLRESIQLILAGLQADSAAYLCDHLFGK